MRIVIPILGFGRTGGYRVISKLGSEWVRAGHRVDIFVNHSSEAPYFATEATIRWLNDSGREVDGSSFERLRHRRGFDHVARNMWSLWMGLNRYGRGSDVLLANHSLTAWPVCGAFQRCRRFYYVQAYEAEYYANTETGPKRLLQLAAWLSYFLPFTRIVNTPAFFNYRNLRSQLFVPPGIDLDVFHPSPDRIQFGKGTITLGCIGRTQPQKGTLYVLKAYEQLRGRGHDVRLRVAYGNIPETMRHLPDLEVVVPKCDSELAEFYRSIDILVAAAVAQTISPHYPGMEALACGTPVITTGFLAATSANAWLVPAGDAGAIADAVEAVLSSPELRASRSAQGVVDIRAFAWPSVASMMLQHFQTD